MTITEYSYATVHGTVHIACFMGVYGISIDYPRKAINAMGPHVGGYQVWYMNPNGQTDTPKELRS